MQIIKTVKSMRDTVHSLANKTIGFVPTMGFLHEGHLSLVEKAKKENDIVVMSIFVNPLQFGPNEDFDDYPRDEKRDAQIASKHGVDYLFIPSTEDMYPTKVTNIKMKTLHIANVLCGRSRPGHFDGVITVLTKLFNIVNPHNVYFGMKDAQQLAVVKSLVTELNFPINVIGVNTVREEDGLAKSSRNVYLSDQERQDSLALYKSLRHGQKLIIDGIKSPATIKDNIKEKLNATTGEIDYIEVLTYPNLEEVQDINETIIIAVAVRFNEARLIDNIILTKDGQLIERIN